jgi:3-hydroxybutyryl-CoA dehydrogenase
VKIESIGIIGGGVMGSGIGQTLAVGGAQVTIRDINDEMIAKSRSTIVEGRYGLNRGVERGKTTQEEADAALSRLSWTTDVADLAAVDLIIEAVPEDIGLKKKVFGELDAIVKAEAIFASNTSGLAISDINKGVSEARRPQFIGMHFFSPAPVMQLVEIVHAPETAEETIAAIEDLCGRADKATVRVKDAPGQYGFKWPVGPLAMIEGATKGWQ